MRRVPSGVSRTSPASFSTRRCCDTAGRLTGSPRASSPTADGRAATRSKIARRVGSASAAKLERARSLAMAYRKPRLTPCQPRSLDTALAPRQPAAGPARDRRGHDRHQACGLHRRVAGAGARPPDAGAARCSTSPTAMPTPGLRGLGGADDPDRRAAVALACADGWRTDLSLRAGLPAHHPLLGRHHRGQHACP